MPPKSSLVGISLSLTGRKLVTKLSPSGPKLIISGCQGCIACIMKRTKENEEKRKQTLNFVNCPLDLQVAPKEDASCFASSNSFSKQEHLYSGGPSLPRLFIFKTSAHLNADHQILTFRGLSSNFQSHKVFVGHHGKRYDARCHFSRGHPF